MAKKPSSLFKKFFTTLGFDAAPPALPRTKKASARPTLELLEDRTAPATFGTVQGTAFLDRLANGVLDAKDARLHGVKVTLIGTTAGANVMEGNTSINVTTVTDAKGVFKFTNVPEGTYKIQTNAVTGITQGAPKTITGITIDTNGEVVTQNILYTGGLLPASLSMRQFLTNKTASSYPYGKPGAGKEIANHTPTATAIADVSIATGSGNTFRNLAAFFKDADFTNSEVTFHITNGTTTSTIKMILFDTQTPQTVANFFDYIVANKYDASIFHRLTTIANSGIGVLQGGALNVDATGKVLTDIAVIPAGATVPNEFKAANSNLKGTIAMAQSGGINTATNQFFFNTTDNAGSLDSQKFTVFGKIADAASQAALDALAASTTKDISGGTFAAAHPTALLNNMPLKNYSGDKTTFPTDAVLDNYMRITDISINKRTEFLTYSLVGANGGGDAAVATATITNEYLAFTPVAAGTTTFTIKATDRYGATVTQTVKVTVTGNHAPVATDLNITTNQDQSINGTLPASDVDAGNSLTYSIVSNPAKGSVNLLSTTTGLFNFNPGNDFKNLLANQNEQVTFTFKATDNNGAVSQTKTVTVTVTGLNDTPIAQDGTNSTNQNTSVNGTLVANDADPGDTLTYEIVQAPAKGSVQITNDATGAYTFDPGTDFIHLGASQSEQATFTFKATDNHNAASVGKTITILVTGINDLPTATSAGFNATAVGVSNGQLAGTDPDDGETATLTYALVDPPSKGIVTVNPDGTFSFDPNGEFAGLGVGATEDVTFTFKVKDAQNAESAAATITVTVTG